MKLSKAKKLFKAGEIQIHDFNSDFELLKKVTGTNWTHYKYYYCDGKEQYGSMTKFKNTPIVNLSDIKPRKKKSLKKKVKELKQDLIEAHEVIDKLEIQLDYLKNHPKQDFSDILRATTEPKQ